MSRAIGLPLVLLVLHLAVGCAAHVPGIAIGPLRTGLDTILATRTLGPGENLRADELGRTVSASYHLVQVRGSEPAHRHAAHDLTILVLRGRGTLSLGAIRVPLVAGDAAVVPRGEVHRFTNEGDAPAAALAVFTPPLDAPDSIPADDR